MTENALKILKAFHQGPTTSSTMRNDALSLAAAIRKIIEEFEQYVENDSYDKLFVSSQDLRILINDLENPE